MKQNRHQVTRNGSITTPASQHKSQRSRAQARRKSPPCIALLAKGAGGALEGGINLSKAQYGALLETFGYGDGALIFMVKKALEKAYERKNTPTFQGVPASRTPDSQPQTAQSRAEVYPAPSTSPCIALFPEGDDSASEEVIDLSKAEYAALKQAAAPVGSGVLMFMANAGLEKAGAPALSSPARGGLIVNMQPPDGGESTSVQFSPEERLRIEAALKRTGMPLEAFMQRALENYIGCSEFAASLSSDQFVEMVAKETRTRTGRSPQLDLGDSINQAIAFLDLLADRYITQADGGGDLAGGARAAGLDEMVRNTINNLHGDFEAVIKEHRNRIAGQQAPVAKAAI